MGDEVGKDVHGNGFSKHETNETDGKNGIEPTPDEGDALGNAKPNYGGVVAKMPVEKFASHYNFGHKSRGLALIFNHEVFTVANLKSRAGTKQDKINLSETLQKLQYDVHVYQDLKFDDIEEHLKEAAKYDHSDYDSLLVCVLSHGDNGIIYAKDTEYKPERLWNRFSADRCPSLAGKPKMFFLQACQGDKLDGGVVLSRTETDGHNSINSYRIPVQADFLIVYSTVKGYYSWRNTTKGSWFIQALCHELNNNAYNYDLLTILTFVAQRVAFDFESNVPDTLHMHQQKQIPCIMSMLTRLIQFPRTGLEETNKIDDTTKNNKSGFRGLFKSKPVNN